MKGGRIADIEPGSPADLAGIQVGECVQTVGATPLTDYLAWLWESDGTELELELLGADMPTLRTLKLERESESQSWGIAFADLIFDDVRRCKNDCLFCFMKQLPEGVRESLTLRDDDYRLSFSQGNFITLSNLEPADIDRIAKHHISPLRVSFHAADPKVREQLMGTRQAEGLRNLEELIAGGIDFHIQIVLVPGINDGDVLDDTLVYLADEKRRPHILSVGIVPVAHTDFAPTQLLARKEQGAPIDYSDEERAKTVIEQVQKWQFAQFDAQGSTWVYLADEFYIHANAPFPLPEYYDGFPQLENGIGMVLNFVAEVREHSEDLKAAIHELPNSEETLTIVCGELLTHTWLGILRACNAGGRVRLLPVRNRFFGGNVSVTGLLTAQDILRAIEYDSEQRLSGMDALPPEHTRQRDSASLELFEADTGLSPLTASNNPGSLIHATWSTLATHRYFIPDVIFNDDGITLDDQTAQQMKDAACAPLCFYEMGITDMIAAIRSFAKELKTDD